MEKGARDGLLRSLAFYSVLKYPPTRAEWLGSYDRSNGSSVYARSEIEEVANSLVISGTVIEQRGRVTFPSHQAFIDAHEEREAWFPRKIRVARQVVRWLARLDGVRFVALCNTTSLAHARDESDLDFFVVVRQGGLWQTRGWSTLPFRFFRRRPHDTRGERDAICLSFFVDDASLDLSPLQLPGNDAYFRYWFLSLLPLYDDGVSQALWDANKMIRERHPLASKWIVAPDVEIRRPSIRIPAFSFLEFAAARVQQSVFPQSLRDLINKDSRVVVNDHVLKFHAEDGRERMRQSYEAFCQEHHLSP